MWETTQLCDKHRGTEETWCLGPASSSSCVNPDLPLAGLSFSIMDGGGWTLAVFSRPNDTARSNHIYFRPPKVSFCINGKNCPPPLHPPFSMEIKSSWAYGSLAREYVSQTPLGLSVALG